MSLYDARKALEKFLEELHRDPNLKDVGTNLQSLVQIKAFLHDYLPKSPQQAQSKQILLNKIDTIEIHIGRGLLEQNQTLQK